MDEEDVIYIYISIYIYIYLHHIYNGIVAIKKNEILPFTSTWMDLESIIFSEVSQTEKDKYSVITYM